MRTLIIIPAYNEAENIGALLDELDAGYGRYDYIVVNDRSKDRTRDILAERNAPYLDLPVNLGIGGGVQAGYMYALDNGYDIAVQMDGDGQHLPAYLDAIIKPVEDGVLPVTFAPAEADELSMRLGVGQPAAYTRPCDMPGAPDLHCLAACGWHEGTLILTDRTPDGPFTLHASLRLEGEEMMLEVSGAGSPNKTFTLKKR